MNEPEDDIYYYLSWSCVDGAGSSPEQKIYDEQKAIDLADAEQAFARKDGNIGSYVYRVRRVWGGRRTDCVYNAATRNHSYY